MNKRGEFNFVWLFALLVGGAILFFSIYGALQIGETQQLQTNTQNAQQLNIITDSLHAGFADTSHSVITFNQETRIHNNCYEDTDITGTRTGFGRNEIATANKKSNKEEWGLPGIATRVNNKYLFSKETLQGETFYVFSKPWKLPYKVSDMIMITTEHYCFRSTPENIKEELERLQLPNIAIENCEEQENPTYICFGNSKECDVVVSTTDGNYEYGIVRKTDGEYHYQGNLLYAALFADKKNYECNVERLIYRNIQQADILIRKATLINARGCSSNLGINLQQWKGQLEQQQKSSSMKTLTAFAQQLEQQNNKELCGLWR